MNWIKWVLISIVILAFIGIGGFVLYNVAYAIGDADGYDNGYAAGHNVGYSSGEQDGYAAGYSVGQEDGYDEGYDMGQVEGYEAGYDDGIQAGLGHGYTLRDPTYIEAVSFLSMDRTDENEYDEDSYVCSHFARDVCNNAEAEGLRCAFVEIRYREAGHSIIAFDTVDRGLVFFEPQFDDEVEVIINQSYSQLNGYLKPSGSDVITDILVIW